MISQHSYSVTIAWYLLDAEFQVITSQDDHLYFIESELSLAEDDNRWRDHHLVCGALR